MERPSGGRADAGLAVDPTPEATLVAEAFRPQAEQLLAELAAAGLRLTANAAQQQAALAAIQAAVKAVAAEAVSDTRRQMAALAAELRPADPSPAGQSLLWRGAQCGWACRLQRLQRRDPPSQLTVGWRAAHLTRRLPGDPAAACTALQAAVNSRPYHQQQLTLSATAPFRPALQPWRHSCSPRFSSAS